MDWDGITCYSYRHTFATEMLKSGDVYQTAEVVRNLSLRKREAHLSAGEEQMLAHARRLLIAELHHSLRVTEEEATRQVDERLGC